MKFSTIVCCWLIAAAGASPALADPYERGTGLRPWAQDLRSRPGREREAQRPARERKQRGPGEEDRGRARMSQEERQQLRRDIQDAGKDIYRPSRRTPMERKGSGRS